MAATSNRERAVQVVLVLLGLFTVVANVYPLVTAFLAGLRPTAGTTAPMFWTMYATLGVFLMLAARNPSVHRSLIAFAAFQCRACGGHGADGDSTSHQTRRAAGRRGGDRPVGRAAVRVRAVRSPS